MGQALIDEQQRKDSDKMKGIEKEELRTKELMDSIESYKYKIDQIKQKQDVLDQRLNREIDIKMDNRVEYLRNIKIQKEELEEKKIELNVALQNELYQLKLMKKYYETQNKKQSQ